MVTDFLGYMYLEEWQVSVMNKGKEELDATYMYMYYRDRNGITNDR